jgi:hypothetical protein
MYRINIAYEYLATVYQPGAILWIATHYPTAWKKILYYEEIDSNEAMVEMVKIYQILLKEYCMPAFDFNGVEPSAQIALGDYRCVVVMAELKRTKSGDDMFALQLQITNQCQFTGIVMYDNLVCSAKSLGRLKMALDSMGLTQQGVNDMVQVEAGHFMGRECDVRVEMVVDKRDNTSKPGLGWSSYLLPGTAQYNVGMPVAIAPPAPVAVAPAPVAVAPVIPVAPAAAPIAPVPIAPVQAVPVAPVAPVPVAPVPVAPVPVAPVPVAPVPVAAVGVVPIYQPAPGGAVQRNMQLKDDDIPF